MLCTSTAGFGFFQEKSKEVCFALVSLAGCHDITRWKVTLPLYFFSLLVLCKKPSNSISWFVKEFNFGYVGGGDFQYRLIIRLETYIWVFFFLSSWIPCYHQHFPLCSALLCGSGEMVTGCCHVPLPKQAAPVSHSYKPTATRQFNRASQEPAYSWGSLLVQWTQSICSYGPIFLGRPRVLVITAKRSARGVGKGRQLMRECECDKTEQFCLFSSIISTNARKSVCKSILPQSG